MNIVPQICLIAALPFLVLTTRHHNSTRTAITMHQQDTTYNTAGLFDAQARPQLISKQFMFTEGPAADSKGNVYFTDQPDNKIWKYSTEGKLTPFAEHAGRSNGMYFDKKGNLLTCADEQNEVWRFTADGQKEGVLLKDINGRQFNGPNDLWIDAKGGIYFTDPYYQRAYWTRKQPDLDGEKVYYLPPGKTQAIIANDQLQKPNGIAGTTDGKYLYVSDIKANKTYKFTIGANCSTLR